MWCGKISPQRQSESTSDCEELNKESPVFKHARPVSGWRIRLTLCTVESGSAAQRACVTTRWCKSVRRHGDPTPVRDRLGRHRLSTLGPVSPPYNVTNPPPSRGVTFLHTPIPSFHFRRQMSEDPRPGTTTGKDGERMESASHSLSPHHFTLDSPSLPSFFSRSLVFSGFGGSPLLL